MKLFVTAAVLWAGIFCANLNAQTYFPKNELNIFDGEELVIEFNSSDLKKYKNNEQWRALLNDFKNHLLQVKDQIPTYDTYILNYRQGVHLKVEQKEKTFRYRVEPNGQVTNYSQNEAVLKAENLQFSLTIHFSELEELLTKDYEIMIQDAMDKSKVSELKNLLYIPTSLNYSYSDHKMLKLRDLNAENRIGLYTSGKAAVGLFYNKPLYEIGCGVGLSFGKNKSALFAKWTLLYQYSQERNKTLKSEFLGLNFKMGKSVSFELAKRMNRPRKTELLDDDTDGRISISAKTRKGLVVTAFATLDKGLEYESLGLSIGFGF